MNIGTEDKKKTAIAAGLSAVALITVYVQFFSGASPTSGTFQSPTATRAAVGAPSPSQPVRRVTTPTRRRSQTGGEAFQPVWVSSQEDAAFNPLEADPTLRMDVLEAVRSVTFSGVNRNIFEYTSRRAEPIPAETARIAAGIQAAAERPADPPPVAPPTPVTPRAPRLSWRYYGFANGDNDAEKRAFLLDGEDVLIGGEGDVFRNRYKIVRIGQTQIVIEDMQFQSEQELALEAPRG